MPPTDTSSRRGRVHGINAFLDHWTSKLPFRGRLLFFATGAVIGAGGLTSAALYLNRLEASVILQQGSGKQDDDDDLGNAGTVCCGAVQRWVWLPWPHWQLSDAELNRTLLLLRPQTGSGSRSATAAALVEAGHCCTAVPMKGATVVSTGGGGGGTGTDDASGEGQLSIHTVAGDVEHLRNFQSGDGARHWQLSLEHAAKTTKQGSTKPAVAGVMAGARASAAAPPRRVVTVSYPQHWQPPFDCNRTVRLDKHSAEYKRVKQLVLKQQARSLGASTWVKGKIKVTGIERVQSPHVWEQYAMRRAIVASENHSDPNETMLWHGTPSKFGRIISRQGFDPRVCSLSGLFGGGVYFADKSTKSVRYAGAQSPGDSGRLFLCRVSLGRQLRKVLPSPGLRRVPDPFPLFPSQLEAWLFGHKCHSLFAPSTTPPLMLMMNEFIVYHSNQGYPEYLIDFELV